MSDSPSEIIEAVRQANNRGGWAVIRLATDVEIGVRFEHVEIVESDGEWETRSLAAPFARTHGGGPRMSGVLIASQRDPHRWWVWATWLEAGPSVIDERQARVEDVDAA
ncbi:hypothetical protein [Natronorubrum thiooxidans]|uniref:Uncharacterized protein n=1 Tax=Natronorubrum thiooxidans TaxID=308853 RepID=A0A1N7G617_9EURY|nr:hypothetical protein [Natronorubrum thiooxidans]SIS07998.1 hypothetical protein SAMN05421752_11018 [Natronorubrum thiooxidans]